jgi:hypothetical protein
MYGIRVEKEAEEQFQHQHIEFKLNIRFNSSVGVHFSVTAGDFHTAKRECAGGLFAHQFSQDSE